MSDKVASNKTGLIKLILYNVIKFIFTFRIDQVIFYPLTFFRVVVNRKAPTGRDLEQLQKDCWL